MKKSKQSSGNFVGLLLAMAVFFGGLAVAVFLWWTFIGLIIGVLMMLASLGMGGNRRKVWKCRSCGYIFDRA
jgi:hypothetical protein